MSDRSTKIAAIESADKAIVQRFFNETATRWRAAGVHVVGLIEEVHGLPDRTCNAGSLRDIVSGKSYSIYLEIPPPHTSCHINAAGAEAAGAAVLEQIGDCDLVVFSKFGKLEAGCGGLIDAFKAAISAGKPVLTSVSSKHRDAWCEFAPTAVMLPANTAAVEAWWDAAHVR